jgi:hypothetical protein
MEDKDLSFFRDFLVKLCVDDDDMTNVNTEQSGVLIAQIVNMMHTMRQNKAENEADAWVVVSVPYVSQPEAFFNRHYKRLIEDKNSESAWHDFWPLDCKWHPTELKKLAEIIALRDNLTRRRLQPA